MVKGRAGGNLISVKNISFFNFNKPGQNLLKLVFTFMWVAGVFVALSGSYNYAKFRQNHTLAEATVTGHAWDKNHLVLNYTYNANGTTFDGAVSSLDDELEQRMDKKNSPQAAKILIGALYSDAMKNKYPIGSSFQIYYQDDNPSITKLGYFSNFARVLGLGLLD